MKDDSEKIARYLLGELSEEEQSLFEEMFFSDPALFHEIRAARDELIDSYLQGELSKDESNRFESYFLASRQRRQRVELSKALMQKFSAMPAPIFGERVAERPSSWMDRLWAFLRMNNRAAALSFASLVILVLGAWLVFEITRMPGKGGESEPEQAEQTRQEELEQQQADQNAEIAQERNANQRQSGSENTQPPKHQPLPVGPGVKVASLVLSPTLVRDPNDAKSFTIPRGTVLVRLQADLQPDDYKRYRVELTTVEGEQVWSQNAIKAEQTRYGKAVVIKVPAERFADQDYILRVSAKVGSGEAVTYKYYFRVVKQ
jgi:hypothetical protein